MCEVFALVFILILLCLFLAFYFLPTIVACYNNEKNAIWIFLVNLTTGWTSLGWILALLWAILERDGSDLVEKIREKI